MAVKNLFLLLDASLPWDDSYLLFFFKKQASLKKARLPSMAPRVSAHQSQTEQLLPGVKLW